MLRAEGASKVIANLVFGGMMVAAVCASVADIRGQSGGAHEDPVHGYSIRAPEGWEFIPAKMDDRWLVARWISDQANTSREGYNIKPTMKVLCFSPEKLGGRGQDYRNYRDYLAADMKATGHGYHIVESETDELRGVAVEKIRVLATRGRFPERAVVTWIFDHPEDESTVAVEFFLYEERRGLLRKEMQKTLKSFRIIERSAAELAAANRTPPWVQDRAAWKKLDAQERRDVRIGLERERVLRYTATVPPGWYVEHSKSKRYLALSHTGKEYTRAVLRFAELARDWMDEHIGGASDEYVMTSVIRICEDYTEYARYRSGSPNQGGGSYSALDAEIVDYPWEDNTTGTFELIGGGLIESYLYDKDPFIRDMPHWLGLSLQQYLGDAYIKGRKLVCSATDFEKQHIKNARLQKKLLSMRELVTLPRHEWPEDDDGYWQYRFQCLRLLRFVTEGPGKKDPLLNDFLPRYLRATIAASEAWRKQQKKSKPSTVEEEEEALRKDEDEWAPRYDFILERVNAECFDFDAKGWEKLEKKFAKYVKK